jgi:hypothetical protein
MSSRRHARPTALGVLRRKLTLSSRDGAFFPSWIASLTRGTDRDFNMTERDIQEAKATAGQMSLEEVRAVSSHAAFPEPFHCFAFLGGLC